MRVAPELQMPKAPVGPQGDLDPKKQAELKKAARQFEGLLIRELVKTMRKSTPMLEGDQGKQYSEMFDSALSDHLADSGGVGLAQVLERSFGVKPEAPSMPADGAFLLPSSVGTPGQGYGLSQYSYMAAHRPTVRLQGGPLTGSTGRLQEEISRMLSAGTSQWAKDGVLGPQDLTSGFATEAGEGMAHFNVRDAGGYPGSYKCNLFALEAVRRGGFKVPVVARDVGWGFPTSDTITEAAATGDVNWAHVATGAPAADVDRAIQQGQGAFMLTGSGQPGRAGHMAVVERVHEIRYDDTGHIRQVVFDGWEARTHGAEHLSRRTWNVAGETGGNLVRGGFSRIELLQLEQADGEQAPEVPLQRSAPASRLDNSSSSSMPNRPNVRPEDAS